MVVADNLQQLICIWLSLTFVFPNVVSDEIDYLVLTCALKLITAEDFDNLFRSLAHGLILEIF